MEEFTVAASCNNQKVAGKHRVGWLTMDDDKQNKPNSDNGEKDLPETGLPEWVELSPDIHISDNSSDEIISALLSQPLDAEPSDGWQKESINDFDDIENPSISNLIDSVSTENDDTEIQQGSFPDSELEIEKMASILPKWLENVVEAEELKDTTKLKIKRDSSLDFIEEIISATEDVHGSQPANELLSSISTQDLHTSDTRPTFIQIISGDQVDENKNAAEQVFPELIELLRSMQTAQAYKLGQQLILDKDNLDLLIGYLSDWLTQFPNTSDIWHLLGDAQMRNDQPSEAIKAFAEAKRLISR